jgi:hypothetical protein
MDSSTELIYLTYEGNFQHKCESVVVSCTFINPPLLDIHNKKKLDDNEMKLLDENKTTTTTRTQQWVEIILESTVFHPQGGGQPYDTGIIYNETTKAIIDRVICSRETNIVKHVGTIHVNVEEGSQLELQPQCLFPTGSPVFVQVDTDRRNILSECHTAGHVVDAAMARCHQLLPPLKGYHYLDGPYVEYAGNISLQEREHLLPKLKDAFQVCTLYNCCLTLTSHIYKILHNLLNHFVSLKRISSMKIYTQKLNC